MLTLYTKKPFGLDISDHSIEALSLRQKRGKITLDVYKRLIIPSGIITNGIILKPDKLVSYLKKLNIKGLINSFGTNQCLITLPQSQTYAHLVSLPAGSAALQQKIIIQKRIKKIIPMPIEDLAYNYIKVEKTDNQNNEKIFIAAVSKTILGSYLDTLRKAGLEVLAVDVEFLSQARSLLRSYSFKNREAVMIIDSGYEVTNFSFFVAGGAQYIGESKIGGHKMIELIKEGLSLNEEEAEKEKREHGLAKIARNPKFQKVINQLVADIKKSTDYFQQTSQGLVKEIILTGGNALIASLPEFLSTVLKIPTTLRDPFVGIAKDKKLFQKDAALYSNVVGLALRGFYWGEQTEENEINFLKNS